MLSYIDKGDQMKKIVHDKCYKNRALCGVYLMPSAVISKDIEKLTCPECKRIAENIAAQRFIVRSLRKDV